MRDETLLILVIRGLGWADHPASADLDLLLTRPPGVVAVPVSGGTWVVIVLESCAPDVREATERLIAGPLPPAVTRIQEP